MRGSFPSVRSRTYQQLNLIYTLAAPLLLGGVPAALLYFIARAVDAQEIRSWVARAYLALGGMGLIGAAVALLARKPLAHEFHNPELARALALYAPAIFFTFLAAAGPPALVAAGRARLAALLNAALGLSILGASVVAAAISPTGTSLALGLTIAAATLAIISIAVVWRAIGLAGRDPGRGAGVRDLLSYGLPLALSSVVYIAGFQIDRVVVGSSFSPRTFAIYALGAVEIPIGLLLGQAVTNVLAPGSRCCGVMGTAPGCSPCGKAPCAR